jgi:3-oxoacyl-[acyl-carrier protein] reductase
MEKRLKQKNALITGGSRGIGRAIGEEFARQGAGIALLARNPDNLETAADSIRTEVPDAEVITAEADVSDREMVEERIRTAIARLGHLDILVNSAGIASLGNIDEMPPQEWERMIQVNLMGVYHCCRAVWPHFKERRSGSIINISSGSGRRAHGGWTAYCASKFGVMGLTDALQKEGRPHGIRCNVICPGPTDTDQRRSNFPDEDPSTLMQPDHIAEAAVFFAGEESRWVSGPGIDVRREPI